MTRAEAAMLRAIKQLREEAGRMPSRRELAAAAGLAPCGSQQRSILFSLAKQGHLRLRHGEARGIEVLEAT